MFFKRSYSPEIMDDFSINDYKIDQALKELRIINKYLGGNTATGEGFKIIKNSSIEKFNVLDVGSGSSDILSSVNRLNEADIYSVDINPIVCRFLKLKSPKANVICSDALQLPFREKSFEVIHASLFLHHFTEEQISNLLKNFLAMCTLGIIINDLRRSVLAYAGIYILTKLFSRSEIVKNDGPLSVRRAFVKSDLHKIIGGLNLNFIIKRKWAFRWLVVIYK